MERIELLAPAGDLERLKVTLLYGADAVYLGGRKLGLRANATNFTKEELEEGCLFAHKLKKKVYVTLNIFFHDSDRQDLDSYIEELVNCGVDAFIVSDPYLIEYLAKKGLEAHVSTQASITNSKEAMFYKRLGATRVVLARELNKEEIHAIVTKTGLEVEVFLHGAMCTCFSGRCALSNYITNRDANRGGCAQVCRFAFNTSDNKVFTMATKDLNMSSYLKDLIEIGVGSLKIEGRMRSIYYLASVVGSYRALLDAYYEGKLTEEFATKYLKVLASVANRESTSQYFLKKADNTDQYYTGRQEISNQEYIAVITGYDKENNCLVLRERNYFKVGDTIEIFTPQGTSYQFVLEKLLDENNNSIEIARHPDELLKIPFKEELEKYSMIRLIKKG
jgi:collagenase and related proteases